MTFYLSNTSVQPTGFEPGEFLDAPWLPDLRPADDVDEEPVEEPEP